MADKAEIRIDLSGISPDLRADVSKQLQAFNVGLADALMRVSTAEPMEPALARGEGPLKHASHVLAHGIHESLDSTASIDVDLSGVSPAIRKDLAKQLAEFNKGLASDLVRIATAEQLNEPNARSGDPSETARHLVDNGLRERLDAFAGAQGIAFVDSAEPMPNVKAPR